MWKWFLAEKKLYDWSTHRWGWRSPIKSIVIFTLKPGWSIILAFQFRLVILLLVLGQIGFVSLAPVTKYVLIACYDNQIGNYLLEINTKIVFKFRSIITKFAYPFCHSSTLLLIGRQRSRDLFFNSFLAFYWHIFFVFSFFNIRYLELV